MTDLFQAHLQRHIELAQTVGATLGPAVTQAATLVIATLRAGHKLLFCGNGGSAADAQHLAAELTGRYAHPQRRALPALALTTDTSVLTALGNDLGFDRIFARQVEALGQPGDLLIAISTSGGSPNVMAAVHQARHQGLCTIGLLGRDGGQLANLVDLAIIVPSSVTPLIQEMHISLGHLLCSMVDQAFAFDHNPPLAVAE